MGFEPLKTDERVPGGAPKPPDMDRQMLAGCSAFLLVSVLTLVLGALPFFLFQASLHLRATLGLCLALGIGPALVLGALAGLRSGVAGASGFAGGSVSLAVFLYLLLGNIELGHTVKDLPRPDYPPSWTVLLPTLWLPFALAWAALFGRIGERRRTECEDKRR